LDAPYTTPQSSFNLIGGVLVVIMPTEDFADSIATLTAIVKKIQTVYADRQVPLAGATLPAFIGGTSFSHHARIVF
jgi:hypothetical protein